MVLALTSCTKGGSSEDRSSSDARQCKEDADCEQSTPHCNVGKQICVECIVDSQCAGTEECSDYACMQVGVCASNDDCPLGQRCDTARERCEDDPNADTQPPEADDASAEEDDVGADDAPADDAPGAPDDAADDVAEDDSADTSTPDSTQDAPPAADDDEEVPSDSSSVDDEDTTAPDSSVDTDPSDEPAPSQDAGGESSDDSSDTSTEPADTSEDPIDVEPVFPEGTPLVLVLVDASSGVFSSDFDFGGSAAFGEFADVWEGMRHAVSLLAEHSDIRYWPMTYGGVQMGTCPEVDGPDAPLAEASELASFLPPSADAVTDTKREGPLADALSVAYAQLAALQYAGPKHLLVLTDGPPGDTCTKFEAPLCGTDAVYGAAQDAYAQSIRTRIINFGGENGVVFAENLAHAGAGQSVLPVPETELYCLSDEAQARGQVISNATAFYQGGYRDYSLARYGTDGYTYPDDLADDPTDGAELQAAVEAYAAFVLAN